MRRIALYIVAAMIMFIVGVAVNSSFNALGGFAVEKLGSVEPLPELASVTSLAEYPELPPGAYHCTVIISVTDDGTVYLGRAEVGSLRNTVRLKEVLSQIFARDTEFSRERPTRTVYIKAARSLSYGEIADLIKTIREAGGGPIGLVADRRENSY